MRIRNRHAIKKAVSKSRRTPRPWPALVGDGQGTIEVPGSPGLWYVRPVGSSLAIPVYKGAAPAMNNYPVWVGQDVYNRRWVRILGTNLEGMNSTVTTGGVVPFDVEPHGSSHYLTGSDPIYITTRQVADLLLTVVSGMTVRIAGGFVVANGQPIYVTAQNIDLTSHIPTGAARWALIRSNSAGTLSVQDGDEVDSFADLTLTSLPGFIAGYSYLWAVRLYDGQTTVNGSITQAEFFDLRFTQNDIAMSVMAHMVEPTGFINRTTSTIAFTDGTLEFVIAPTGTNFSFYSAGTKYTKTSTAKTIADTVGIHHIYFDTSGVLQESTDEWDINSANVPVAAVLWDGSAGLLMDERHGIQMDGQTQEYLHETRGSAFASGMAGTFAADGSTITISAGEWYDEDIEHITTEQTQCRVFYLDGTTWKWSAAQAPYFTAVSSVPQYNNSGALANVGVAKFSISWVYMTNFTATPIAVIMGQAEYNIQALAEAAGVPALTDLPAEEMILLYKVIWQRNGAVITWKRTDDYRRVLGGPTADYIATDHGALAGLTDPDHPASAITVDVTNFDGNLSATDTTVQAALETLDDMVSGGGGALDDLTDVNAPAPSDGQVLTWDDGGSEWIASDPSGVSAGSELFRIYLNANLI